jgi:hypothetical protein
VRINDGDVDSRLRPANTSGIYGRNDRRLKRELWSVENGNLCPQCYNSVVGSRMVIAD